MNDNMGPWAVYYAVRRDGCIRDMPPSRNISRREDADKLAIILAEQGYVGVHVSLDTCG